MFRIAMTAVLFTLAIGQNAGLLCRVWCDSDVVSGSVCLHAESRATGTVVTGTSCSLTAVETTLFIREDGARGPSALDPVPVLPVAAFQSPPPAATHAHLILAAAPALHGAARPIIALRI